MQLSRRKYIIFSVFSSCHIGYHQVFRQNITCHVGYHQVSRQNITLDLMCYIIHLLYSNSVKYLIPNFICYMYCLIRRSFAFAVSSQIALLLTEIVENRKKAKYWVGVKFEYYFRNFQREFVQSDQQIDGQLLSMKQRNIITSLLYSLPVFIMIFKRNLQLGIVETKEFFDQKMNSRSN